ncbi:hypothetical protein DL96DRAFT_911484 [Flagelloscypha sp. PMI_526]|nr:hypothetical protein DL96DRAFT_911484 [Flagelloscypha sp. PMI_526]
MDIACCLFPSRRLPDSTALHAFPFSPPPMDRLPPVSPPPRSWSIEPRPPSRHRSWESGIKVLPPLPPPSRAATSVPRQSSAFSPFKATTKINPLDFFVSLTPERRLEIMDACHLSASYLGKRFSFDEVLFIEANRTALLRHRLAKARSTPFFVELKLLVSRWASTRKGRERGSSR